MEIKQNFLVNNECYKAGRTIDIIKLMLHSTACPNVSAAGFAKAWNTPRPADRQVCVHAFVDDKEVIQTLPWNHRGWHCGSGSNGSGNNNMIGVEMCEPADYSDKAYFDAAIKNIIELYAYLCKEYGLNANDIISHKEGHSQGVASNHGDPDHWWKFVGYTMNDFRADVANCIANGNVDVSYGNTVKPTQPQTSEGYTTGKTYTLQTELKVRTGAGTNYRAKSHSELTVDGRKHDADGDGALDKGTRVSCLEVAKNGDDIWIRTPSGWLAAYYNGNRYISGEAVSGGSSTSQNKPSSASKPLGIYEVTASDLSVRTGPGTNYPRKTYAELSTDAKKHDYDKDGCISEGTRVTVKEWKNGFARIPSGWVSGDYLKKV